MFNPSTWGTVGQWVAASATLTAVLVALFKDEVVRARRRPILNASIATHPPDSHLTTMQYSWDFPMAAQPTYIHRVISFGCG